MSLAARRKERLEEVAREAEALGVEALPIVADVGEEADLQKIHDRTMEKYGGIDICHETVRYWWNRFGPMFAAEIRSRRRDGRNWSNWRWHLDEVFVRINGETRYLWRAVDHEGEVLEVLVTKRRDRRVAPTGSLRVLDCRFDRFG